MDYQAFASAVSPFRNIYLSVFVISLIVLYGYTAYEIVTDRSARVRAMNSLKVAFNTACAIVFGMWVFYALI